MVNVGALSDDPQFEEKPRLVLPENMKPDRVTSLLHQSSGWQLDQWTDADLVLSQAALRHMLKIVESELGKRRMINPIGKTR